MSPIVISSKMSIATRRLRPLLLSRSAIATILLVPSSRRLFSHQRSSQDALRQPETLTGTDQRNNSPNEVCDVLIVGAGAAGLCAALRAKSNGLKPLLIEKADKIGGASAYSGGGVWIPNNHISKAAGVPDSLQNALEYLGGIIGDAGPVSTRERRLAFLNQGPKMVEFLDTAGFDWVCAKSYPDYYPDKPGGNIGRTIEGGIFDMKKLGDWEQHILARPDGVDIAMHTDQFHHVPIFRRTWKSFMTVMRVIFINMLGRRLMGQRPVTMGRSLAAQLAYLNKNQGINIWRESPLVKLLVENEKVVGAIVNREGTETRVKTTKGVLLCSGGFAQNSKMRETGSKQSVTNQWTMVPPGDTGDAVQAGMDIGGKLALMDDAWWTPIFVDPATGDKAFVLTERGLPHGIIVDSMGQRFMNECQNYTDCGHDQFDRNEKVPSIPAWLVFDSQYREKYLLYKYLPGITPQAAFDSGFITKADTVEELAKKIKVNSKGLKETIARFNVMARQGIDDDFNRGRSVYDQFFGDPTCKPNPNLGTLEKAPFFAMQIWPGDIGTKGGLLTDEYGRVIGENDKPIQGLYAAGNTSASVMGRTYPGAGATLGPALTFAFIAMDHVSGKS